MATSWDEIARRAGVGVGTVYRHFPTYDELLPAFGAVVLDLLALPSSERIPTLFDTAETLPERARRLVDEVFGIYERGAPFIENARRERHDLPALEQWHRMIEDTLDALTVEALRPAAPDAATRRAVRAITDVRTWSALVDHELTPSQAKDMATRLVTELVSARLDLGQRPPFESIHAHRSSSERSDASTSMEEVAATKKCSKQS
jgi:AcrR family transcriptional regulator